MKKLFFLSIVSALAITGIAAAQTIENETFAGQPIVPDLPPFAATSTNALNVSIIKHLCDSNLQTANGLESLSSAEKLEKCPAVIKPGNQAATSAVATLPRYYNFRLRVLDNAGNVKSVTAPDYFSRRQICENELNEDINNDGLTATSTCYDISRYIYANVPRGFMAVYENQPIAGTRLGELHVDTGQNATSTALFKRYGALFLDVRATSSSNILLHAYDFRGLTGQGLGRPNISQIERELLRLRDNRATVTPTTTPPNLRELARIQILISLLEQLLARLRLIAAR